MKSFLVGLGLVLMSVVTLHAQATMAPPLQVDVAEVYRRGDYVEKLGQGIRSEEEIAFLEATAPPADDSHKWFITVITQDNCKPCNELKSDLLNKPELQAFVNLTTKKESWAHYNEYNEKDQTQSWRWKGIEIKSYPTIIVQPPLNKRYGDPTTVVMQKTGYGSKDPNWTASQLLAKQLTAALKTYVQKSKQPANAVQPAPGPANYAAHQPGRGIKAEAEPRASYPRYTDNAGERGIKQIGPWGPKPIGLDPPFRPAPKNPAPNVAPNVTPNDAGIPDPLNPDAQTPATPTTPSDQAPTVPLSDTPRAVVVVDGNDATALFASSNFQNVLGKLRERYKNLTVELRDFARIKEQFPSLAKAELPAILVTEDGVVKQALTNLLLPLLDGEPSPSTLMWLAKLVLGGGSMATLGWVGLAAVGVVWLIRRRRAQQGQPALLTPEMQTLLKGLVERVKENPELMSWVEQLLKPKPKTPA